MPKEDFDAIVIGSGPNGLAAAITLQQEGLSVLLLESAETIGGGLRTKELTLPGFRHDVCSAIHPLAAESPFFKTLPLHLYGLEYIDPPISAAHPFEDGGAAYLTRSFDATIDSLGPDGPAYRSLIQPVLNDWEDLVPEILDELHIPKHPVKLARFGLKALTSASFLAGKFKTKEARGLWGGMAAHAILPLDKLTTSAIGLVLSAAGHVRGWPIPKGGSQNIATALSVYFTSLGGKIETNFHVRSLGQLPSSRAVFFDVTPKQMLEIAGHRFSPLYQWQLNKYRYGMGVFKVDWALDGPVPFINEQCRNAGTVHLGNTFEEIRDSEKQTWRGGHPEKPFVLLAQQSLFDTSRTPEGKHAVWAYCHVPNGSTVDMTKNIENQIERFAPGFKDRILATSTMNTGQMEAYNPNYVGGDINGGALDITQLFTRPALRWSPYRTSVKGLYICSSSAPPGGGVHGMCGHRAAKRALREVFGG